MFETGTAATLADLMTALNTFAVTTTGSWTSDLLNIAGGKLAFHRDDIWVSFRWDTTTPSNVGIYQALAFTDPPGTDATDSGNGVNTGTNATLANERHINALGNGPFTYWFFEQDTYIHVCVESSADVFKHFGMGQLVKTGDWTGGEYVYGHYKTSNGPIANTDTLLLDGFFHDTSATNKARAATLHIEGLPNQVASGKWGQVAGSTTTPQTDTAGVAKSIIQGGFRGGPTATQFGRFSAGSGSGGIPMYPIELYYYDTANLRVYYLGYQPDVRGVNIRNFAPRDVVPIGGESWYIFPGQNKSTGSSTTGSNNLGIAYRRDDG